MYDDTASLDSDPDAPFPSSTAPLPARVGRYVVHGELGEGGMGRVLDVEDVELGRRVAAKILHDHVGHEQRVKFLQEAQLTGQLEHPSIIAVYGLERDDAGDLFYTMRRVRGETLEALLERRPGLLRLLDVYLRICEAVAYAHSRGVVHRDLKPSNVMVGRFGEVVVMDWGIAKLLGAGEPHHGPPRRGKPGSVGFADTTARAPDTRADQVVGTPAYMAPEQACGEHDKIDERTDVWALGALLYELLTGHPPFEAETLHVLLEKVSMADMVPPSERAPDVPWELEQVVLKAMSIARSRRYQSVEALRADIAAYLEGRLLTVARYSRWQRLGKWARRHRGKLAVAAPLLLILAVVAGMSIARRLADARTIAAALTVAEQQRDAARRQRDVARRQRAELLRLSDAHQLGELRARRDRLWLGRPTRARLDDVLTALATWGDRAAELRRHLPQHRATLQRLESGGSGHAVAWQRGLLVQLVQGLERLESDLAETAARRARYATLADRTARGDWTRAAAEVARTPAYQGLRLTPQLGLVPLGADPRSGLQEFAVLDTGRVPRRVGRDLELAEDSAVVLVLLPGARTTLGARDDPHALDSEVPAHPMTLAPYFIAKHELTQAQWQTLTGHNPSVWRPGRGRITLRHPVDSVSWRESVDALARVGLTLPTEARWEHAARGGTAGPWWSGDRGSVARAGNVADRAFAAGKGQGGHEAWHDGHVVHAPVGAFAANPFGLHDTIGNVYEWCLDRFVTTGYRVPQKDPTGLRDWPANLRKVAVRVLRGGSWTHRATMARSSFRAGHQPTIKGPSTGLRPARDYLPAPPSRE